MKILTRMCTSLDGFLTTPQGWPAQLADPAFSPDSYGFVEFQQQISAVLMGRTTFEPALGADQWPWPDLGVFVLGSDRPTGTPEHVVVDSDPRRLLERMQAAHPNGDVHLVGGPATVAAFHQIGALDQLGLLVLPFLLGDGLQLTPSLAPDATFALNRHTALANGVVDVVYDVAPRSG